MRRGKRSGRCSRKGPLCFCAAGGHTAAALWPELEPLSGRASLVFEPEGSPGTVCFKAFFLVSQSDHTGEARTWAVFPVSGGMYCFFCQKKTRLATQELWNGESFSLSLLGICRLTLFALKTASFLLLSLNIT